MMLEGSDFRVEDDPVLAEYYVYAVIIKQTFLLFHTGLTDAVRIGW